MSDIVHITSGIPQGGVLGVLPSRLRHTMVLTVKVGMINTII